MWNHLLLLRHPDFSRICCFNNAKLKIMWCPKKWTRTFWCHPRYSITIQNQCSIITLGGKVWVQNRPGIHLRLRHQWLPRLIIKTNHIIIRTDIITITYPRLITSLYLCFNGTMRLRWLPREILSSSRTFSLEGDWPHLRTTIIITTTRKCITGSIKVARKVRREMYHNLKVVVLQVRMGVPSWTELITRSSPSLGIGQRWMTTIHYSAQTQTTQITQKILLQRDPTTFRKEWAV